MFASFLVFFFVFEALVPVFALGRAQELLLLLEELWARSPPALQVLAKLKREHTNFESDAGFFAEHSNLLRVAAGAQSSQHLLHVSHLHERSHSSDGSVQKSVCLSFHSKSCRRFALSIRGFVFSLGCVSGSQLLNETGPCVVLASPGMLQSGFSRQVRTKNEKSFNTMLSTRRKNSCLRRGARVR